MSILLASSIRTGERDKLISHISTLKHADSETYFYFGQYVEFKNNEYTFKRREFDGIPNLIPSDFINHICDMLHKEGDDDEALVRKDEETFAAGLEASSYQVHYLNMLKIKYNGIGYKLIRDTDLAGSPFCHTPTSNTRFPIRSARLHHKRY